MNKKVLKLLEESESSRGNEKALYIEYIKKYSKLYEGLDENVKADIIGIILEVPLQSSLQRHRAYIQNRFGLFLPSERIVRKRRDAQITKRKEYARDNTGLLSAVARWFNK